MKKLPYEDSLSISEAFFQKFNSMYESVKRRIADIEMLDREIRCEFCSQETLIENVEWMQDKKHDMLCHITDITKNLDSVYGQLFDLCLDVVKLKEMNQKFKKAELVAAFLDDDDSGQQVDYSEFSE